MRKIFLSYSSKDKSAVRRLVRDLEKHNVTVWVDYEEMKVGDDHAEKLQQGVKESEFLGIWLTRHSLDSGWVSKEWTSKLEEEVKHRKTYVLPLLADDVELPSFLASKHFADFRNDYQSGLGELLRVLNTRYMQSERTVSEYADDLLADLADSHILLPQHDRIELISTLKRLPRSGKKIRLETYRPKVPIRTVYDHLLSVCHSADRLFPLVKHGIHAQEKNEIARCIVYHDLPEVLLGDIPAYTNPTEDNRNPARISVERRLKALRPGEPKRIASEFISMFLDDRERASFETAGLTLSDASSRVGRFVHLLDKIDPIIAVWRYLHRFRRKLDPGAEDFLRRMKDFFDNPSVKQIATGYREDGRIKELVLSLLDRKNAQNYYANAATMPAGPFRENTAIVKDLVEGTRLTFVSGDKQRKSKGGIRRG